MFIKPNIYKYESQQRIQKSGNKIVNRCQYIASQKTYLFSGYYSYHYYYYNFLLRWWWGGSGGDGFSSGGSGSCSGGGSSSGCGSSSCGGSSGGGSRSGGENSSGGSSSFGGSGVFGLVVAVVMIVVAVIVVAVVEVALMVVVAMVIVEVVIVVVAVVVVVVEKKFSLTLPWVVLFSDSRLYQSPGSLRTRRRTCAVPRRALFCSSTSLIVSGIWASQPGNLSAIAPSAPAATGITIIFTLWTSVLRYAVQMM